MAKITVPDEFDDRMPFEDPLAKYYRMPGVQVKLPSGGVFMPPGGIEFTMNDDVPVYPMRAADELLLKSPDALISGHAIEQLLKSCVPAIKLPRLLASPDLDVLLLAIRAATYGELMRLAPECPKCHTVTEVSVNLGTILGTCRFIPPDGNSVRLNDEIVVQVRPYTLDSMTRIGIVTFEETRKVQASEGGDEAARSAQINQSMQRVVNASMEALASSIVKIVVKEGAVADPASIRKFLANVSKRWVDKVQEKIDEINSMGIDKRYDAVCTNCQHTWQPEIEFNPATFFASAS